jgi:hypothetical protein
MLAKSVPACYCSVGLATEDAVRAPASQRITASFQISGSCAARPHRDGTGALLWALLADETVILESWICKFDFRKVIF